MNEKKYAAPTKFNKDEYKSIWEHQLDHATDWYIQVSKDKENPRWIKIGEFFTTIYSSLLGDGLFMEEQIGLFEQQEEKKDNDAF